ncbi:MAG: hypothetical protein KY464_10150, partial [Gemmatimonadetes bacterium]|nr:hypothetical protein [Gemmatimonadota bacterium]
MRLATRRLPRFHHLSIRPAGEIAVDLERIVTMFQLPPSEWGAATSSAISSPASSRVIHPNPGRKGADAAHRGASSVSVSARSARSTVAF